MRILMDLHTHTVASGHAYSTIMENAKAAAEKGLEGIAMTDHGPAMPGGAHLYHFWNLTALPQQIAGVRVLRGVEERAALVLGTDMQCRLLVRYDDGGTEALSSGEISIRPGV